jgi:Flp pilus assembly protein TadD
MKKILLICFLAAAALQLHAQEAVGKRIEKLVMEGQYTAAEGITDSILMQNPGNVDALMYKGNLQYYKSRDYNTMLTLVGNPEESVYSSEYAYIGQYTETVAKEVADTCAFYFINALKINPARDDIRLGLCYMYSVSLQADKVIELLPTLKSIKSVDAYSIRDYAYNIIERGEVAKGMMVYEKISSLYPEDGNLMTDMAVEYFINDDVKNALRVANISSKLPGLDTITYNNLFFLYGVNEQFEEAIANNRKLAALTKNNLDLFYEGLVLMLQKNPDAIKKLKEYVKATSDNTPEKGLANLLIENNLNINPDQYDTIFSFGLSDAYNIVLSHHFYNTYRDAFSPGYNYAESLTYNKRYEEAALIFPTINTAAASPNRKSEYHFYYAWALHQSNNDYDANRQWLIASESSIPYLQAGANYFLGKYYFDSGDFVTARKYFLAGANAISQSKYSAFCSDYLGQIK